MIITQSGVGTPFVFAGTGDEYVVTGVITNLGTVSSAVISATLANTVTNQGEIASFGGGSAIALAAGGSVANAGGIAGAIVAGGRLGLVSSGNIAGFVLVTQDAASAGSSITNRGTLVFAEKPGNVAHLANAAITLADSNDTVVNSGKIAGDIHLGGGNDVFDGRGGAVLGTVFGGLGDDLYFLTQETALVDTGGTDTVNARTAVTLAAGIENLVQSGFGNFTGIGNSLANVMTGNGSANVLDGQGNNDTLLGGNGNDTLRGNTGNDSQDGQGGNDRVLGGYGNDVLLGGDGADTLQGETGADSLQGGVGADLLDGGVGGDRLEGGDGDDTLSGGAFGTDVMTGGAGADRFVFTSAQDSFATLAADQITDFTQGQDRIDLSALVPGTLAFMGSAAFSTAEASVRAVVQGGRTTVLIDIDKNGVAEMQIYLAGSLTLTAGDFVL